MMFTICVYVVFGGDYLNLKLDCSYGWSLNTTVKIMFVIC